MKFSKIAITGHTKGLGKFLFNKLSKDYSVLKTSFRIENSMEIINEVKECDVFINNAHYDFHQVVLFNNLFDKWKSDPSKLIINIGSRSAEPNLSKGFIYSSSKSALMHAVKLAVFNCSKKKCRVSLLNLGLLESNLPSLEYGSVYELIKYILKSPPNVEFPIVYLQDSHSYKDVQILKENDQFYKNSKS